MVMNDSSSRPSRSNTMSNSAAVAAPAAAANPPAKDDSAAASSITVNTKPSANFPAPKTDKPRPHVCATCQRSFARLEHLKRHERSHTKEKPFECPECARCFARRDLLLRHQQKLHQTSTPSARPRNRRESASGATPAQARRKNSVAGANASNANTGNGNMRPRANTISHVDGSAMQLLASANANVARNAHAGHNRHASLLGLPNADHVFGGMSMAMGHRGMQHGLGKLDTLSGSDLEAGLRTAPPMPFSHDFDFENFVFGSSSTINPNALHYNDAPVLDRHSPFGQGMHEASQMFEDSLDWVSGFEQQMNIQGKGNENAIDGSSPSAISTTSQSGMSDVMVDGSNHPVPAGTSAMWQPSVMGPPQLTNPFAMELNGSVFPDLLNGAPVSPQPASQKINDPYFSTPPTSLSSLSPSAVSGLKTQSLNQPPTSIAYPDLPSPLPTGNNGASPVTTITDATRTAIVNTLSSTQLFSGRRAPTSAGPSSITGSSNQFKVPSVPDLQRFVAAYLSHFHTHFPFLHIPTLSFDLSTQSTDEEGAVGGRGCLLLGISMIGALYERENTKSKDMFDLSKKMIFLFLEERRKAEMTKAAESRRSVGPGTDHSSQPSDDGSDTPLWLVQAMLLNVAYGHNVSDKIATDIASTHCTALVSLAQAAGLPKPMKLRTYNSQDTHMTDDGAWGRQSDQVEHMQWVEWKIMEERKRTLYAVFVMSSLLVTAYNHAPALTNSELSLDLPCDEEFFAAESATAFFARGGPAAASHNVVSFCDALGELLRSSERYNMQDAPMGNPAAIFTSMPDQTELSKNKLKPSSFGCLMLMYALHNFIWETRQRHENKIWTNEETEKMHRHIEPALRAWQVAWASNPHHHVQDPNPFGLGPLSADAIPLLDLAYVRLFIELSRAKERFWDRDWEGLSAELAKGTHNTAGSSPESSEGSNGTDASGENSVLSNSSAQSGGSDAAANKFMLSGGVSAPGERVATRREKHLRKASFFAADSLAMSGKLGTSLADAADFDLPLQAALCSFECLQVLAEWVATLQDRVGRYIGILGKDKIDLAQMPAIMVLEEDDIKLLEKVQNIVEGAEMKIKTQLTANGMSADHVIDDTEGYCAKLMRLMGMVMEKAGVWQVYYLMAQCLAAQSVHARLRAEKSVLPAE